MIGINNNIILYSIILLNSFEIAPLNSITDDYEWRLSLDIEN